MSQVTCFKKDCIRCRKLCSYLLHSPCSSKNNCFRFQRVVSVSKNNCIDFKKSCICSKKKMLYEFLTKCQILFIFLKIRCAWGAFFLFSEKIKNISAKDIVPGTMVFGCFLSPLGVVLSRVAGTGAGHVHMMFEMLVQSFGRKCRRRLFKSKIAKNGF